MAHQDTVNERARAALDLGDRAWRDFDTRRTYEWKANLSLWAALGGFAIVFLKGDTIPLPRVWKMVVICILVAIDLVYFFIWSPGLFQRNRADQDVAHIYWREAARLARLSEPPPPKISSSAFLNWSHASQMLITLFLTLVAALSLCRSPAPPVTTTPSRQVNFFQTR